VCGDCFPRHSISSRGPGAHPRLSKRRASPFRPRVAQCRQLRVLV
jgi:hypothetical protein